jgi:hypothetical protein
LVGTPRIGDVTHEEIDMTVVHASRPAPTLSPTARAMTIDGKRFEITVSEQAGQSWHWMITAPGELALSGDAASEIQALNCACRAGRALARLGAA